MSKYRVTRIKANGDIDIAYTSSRPSISYLQKLMGAVAFRHGEPVDTIPLQLIPEFKTFSGAPCQAYCDEEGKLKALPENWFATKLWHRQLSATGVPFRPDLLAGTVLVVQKEKGE